MGKNKNGLKKYDNVQDTSSLLPFVIVFPVFLVFIRY